MLCIGANVLQLPEGGDFEALHNQPSRNFDRCTKLDLTTEPPLLGRCCWLLCFFFLSSFKCQFSCLRFGYSYPLFQNLLYCLQAPLIYL